MSTEHLTPSELERLARSNALTRLLSDCETLTLGAITKMRATQTEIGAARHEVRQYFGRLRDDIANYLALTLGRPVPTKERGSYGPGTNTGHGHVWSRPDGVKARCGGPGMCDKCSIDQYQYGQGSARLENGVAGTSELMRDIDKLSDEARADILGRIADYTYPTAAAASRAGGEPFDKRCADALADEVAVLVRRGVLDMRSPAADALLDYRNPPSSPRADRLAELEGRAPAPRGGVTDSGILWSFVRSVLEQGRSIQMDNAAGKYETYEHLSARIDTAARERADELEAALATPPAAQAQGPSGLTVIASTADFAEAWEKYKAALADLHAHLEARIAALKSEAADKPVASS